MPIKPENKKHYAGKTWQYFRAWTLKRALNKCQFCGVINHRIGSRSTWGYFLPEHFIKKMTPDDYKFHFPIGKGKLFKIVLTVAHLDHDPTNNHPDNLRALCQKCHLNYDQEQHQKNAAETRKTKADANRPLFDGLEMGKK